MTIAKRGTPAVSIDAAAFLAAASDPKRFQKALDDLSERTATALQAEEDAATSLRQLAKDREALDKQAEDQTAREASLVERENAAAAREVDCKAREDKTAARDLELANYHGTLRDRKKELDQREQSIERVRHQLATLAA